MIIICKTCSSRLQVDDAKVLSRPFTVRCPKCNSEVNAGADSPNPALEQSALSSAGAADSGNSRFAHPSPAPLFELDHSENSSDSNSIATEKLAELLSGLMNPGGGRGMNSSGARPLWNPRRALVCLAEVSREQVARSLAENGYQVFVAEDTRQAVERMRENQLDVVIIDPKFDSAEQGSVFVTREVNMLRPAQRRRLFFVLLSQSVRTMDAHSAFLNNVNAVVNTSDAADLPTLIEHRIRDFNELYKEFNEALNVHAL